MDRYSHKMRCSRVIKLPRCELQLAGYGCAHPLDESKTNHHNPITFLHVYILRRAECLYYLTSQINNMGSWFTYHIERLGQRFPVSYPSTDYGALSAHNGRLPVEMFELVGFEFTQIKVCVEKVIPHYYIGHGPIPAFYWLPGEH